MKPITIKRADTNILGLPAHQIAQLRRLNSPALIQDFVTSIPANFEVGGETCLPVAEVLRQRRAHCIEGAFVAAAALWLQGRPPLVLDLKARDGDTDHVVTLFQENGLWGAISKSNHVWLRWRDPVYRSMRELALSYFHEYLRGDEKTLWSYSRPFDLRECPLEQWVSGNESCWDIAWKLDGIRHYQLFPKKQIRHLRRRDKTEQKGHQIVQFSPPTRK